MDTTMVDEPNILRRFADELGARQRRRVERDLVGPGAQHRADVVDATAARRRRTAG